MKLTKAQLAGELSRPELYLLHYGRLYAVTALATSMDEANAHMAANPGEGLLAEHGEFCFIAEEADTGAAGVAAIARAFALALAEASPGELKEAAQALGHMGNGYQSAARARRIAEQLAPIVSELRK